jgi:hypothetical protein
MEIDETDGGGKVPELAAIESARADLAERISRMMPKTSASASDLVAIIRAAAGAKSLKITQTPTSSSYSSGSSSWVVEITYSPDPNQLEIPGVG